MKKIIVSVTNDISNDQRVAKVCNSLLNFGFEVLLVGRQLPGSLVLNRAYKTKRFKLFYNTGFLFYAEYNIRLFFYLFFTKKDVLLSNDLDTLLPNYFISKIQNKKLVYDSHELFSEVPELVNKPKVKKFWVGLEQYLLPKLSNAYTVCGGIAAYYQGKYGTKFKIIRNVPVYKNILKIELPFDTREKKIILYQGAINLGRGIELMIDAMLFLGDFILVIAGNGDVINDLKERVKTKKLENKVLFLGKLLPEDLYKITPHASIGLSLEEDIGLSYHYALPNKLFDYIQAEIPVLVSDLPEMKRIVNNYDIGGVLINRTPEKIAEKIIEITSKDYSINLKEAKKELTWENEEKELFEVFKNFV